MDHLRMLFLSGFIFMHPLAIQCRQNRDRTLQIRNESDREKITEALLGRMRSQIVLDSLGQFSRDRHTIRIDGFTTQLERRCHALESRALNSAW